MPPKCNQCDSVTINGAYCHERECPNINKFWDEHNQEWVEEIFDDFEYLLWDNDLQEYV